jgi:hypothetical protein
MTRVTAEGACFNKHLLVPLLRPSFIAQKVWGVFGEDGVSWSSEFTLCLQLVSSFLCGELLAVGGLVLGQQAGSASSLAKYFRCL